MTEDERAKWDERYEAAAHGVQSATRFMIENYGDNGAGADHKHLRTGLNLLMRDLGSVSDLLIKKGVITEEEYFKAIVEGTEKELHDLTETIRERTGLANLSFG